MIRRKKRIYWDTSAGTPLDRRVRRAMKPYFEEKYGNPSSIHLEGKEAFSAKETARKKIAELIGAHADEIVFVSGGTESNNLAVLGAARALLTHQRIEQPGHIITTQVEHAAVLESCRVLEKEGWRVSYLPVRPDGVVDPKVLEESLSEDTVLVSVIYANNEIGTIQPLEEIKKVLKRFREKRSFQQPLIFHTDACQVPRFLKLNVEKLGVDLLSFNGSKIYGPKGIGALYLRRGTICEPLIVGGGQEKAFRSGTENLAGIVGLAAAMEVCEKEREKESNMLAPLRDYFIMKVRTSIPSVHLNGSLTSRLPHNANLTFDGVFAELLLLELDHYSVACSTGSACSFHSKDESHVIKALGHSGEYADSTLRFTFGRDTTKKDVDYVVKILTKIVEKIRKTKI